MVNHSGIKMRQVHSVKILLVGMGRLLNLYNSLSILSDMHLIIPFEYHYVYPSCSLTFLCNVRNASYPVMLRSGTRQGKYSLEQASA